MSIESAFRAVIIADAGVKAITTRMYPNYIPQNPTYPLIVYQKVAGRRVHHLGGPSGKAHPRIQVEAWAATYNAAKVLANAIREAIDGKTFTEDGITFYALIQSEFDSYEDAVEVHRIIMDFSVRHTE